jgi:ankyrin repeat protein
MAWLLEHGASLKQVGADGRGIAHLLALAETTVHSARSRVLMREFGSRWLHLIIKAEPSLLEARDDMGCTPLLAAAEQGCEVGVATLLELGADLYAATPAGLTAVAAACDAMSLPTVRQLIAAGAISAAEFPPGSPQARTMACNAVVVAATGERGCGKCAARCGGVRCGNCADALDILRAMLAAGMREAVAPDGGSLAVVLITCMNHFEGLRCVSTGHALTVLQTLHAAGVDVLARGTREELSVMHEAVVADAAPVVHWLATVVGAPLDERNSSGFTPLLFACGKQSWAAAHALLDCGARVDVQSTDAQGLWPLLAATACSAPEPLMRRLLAADRGSLLRRAGHDPSAPGATTIHFAASRNPGALKLLLASGLPHLAEVINSLAVQTPSPDCWSTTSFSPLHGACLNEQWDAALALLAAGARVDIADDIDGKFQSIAQWIGGRRALRAQQRGLALAIAARAREHAAQAAQHALAAVEPSGISSGEGASSSLKAFAVISAAAATPGLVCAGAGHGGTRAADGCAATSRPVAPKGKQPAKGGKGKSRGGAARKRAEDPSCSKAAAAPVAPTPAATAVSGAPASAALNTCEESAAVLNTCEEGSAALNACEEGAGVGPAETVAATACPETGDRGAATAPDNAVTIASRIAALHCGETSAAVLKQHLAALSELARDPAAAAELESQGIMAAVGAVVARHGASLRRAVAALMTALSESAAGDGEE